MDLEPSRQIKAWWSQHVNVQPVWLTNELPLPSYGKVLVKLGLAYSLRRNLIVLGKPDTRRNELESAYFHEILSKVLGTHGDYAIAGITAIRHYLGDQSIPQSIAVWASTSNMKISFETFEIVLVRKPDFFTAPLAGLRFRKETTDKGSELVFESPESLLLSVRKKWADEQAATISAFIKSYPFDLNHLWTLISAQKRPVVAQRLAGLFAKINKPNEAKLMEAAAALSSYRLPGKESTSLLPPALQQQTYLSDPPYVVRFRDELKLFAARLAGVEWRSKAAPAWGSEQIRIFANAAKKYDAYHSSTIEGYRVTPDEVQALMNGNAAPVSSAEPGEIENRMAIKGYLDAFEYTLDSIVADFGTHRPLTETSIQDIFAHLFSPSVDAGIVSRDELKRYRNHPVYLQVSRYVPPQHAKVQELMSALVEEINEIPSAPVRALVAHYGFVTAHPYKDGNGRTARLLMNYVLGRNGIPWLTIRIEDRTAYFKALEAAQVEQNIDPFRDLMQRYFDALPETPPAT